MQIMNNIDKSWLPIIATLIDIICLCYTDFYGASFNIGRRSIHAEIPNFGILSIRNLCRPMLIQS